MSSNQRGPSCQMYAVIVSSLVFAATGSGCATGYHYSQLYGTRYFITNIDTYPVSINRVDGQSPLIDPQVRLDPGMRTIQVQGPPTITSPGELRSTVLDVRPCMRYYLVAVKASRLDNDFSVRVDYEESVPGCTPPASA